ncbi:MAG: HD domain-containing protein [Anaerolineales bacterium]|nr:HD domain-containing protein [Anaerolineales bacterium]
MKIENIFYRIRQFWLAASAPTPTTEQLALAQEVLNPSQMVLFTHMQAGEQIHSLRVLRTLQAQEEIHPDLLVAALLHDVGKIRCPLRLWERFFIVLGLKFIPRLAKTWGNSIPRGWRRPFVVAEQHPLWGADLALKAGTTPLAASLIRRHQEIHPVNDPNTLEDRLLSALKSADNQQ